MEFAFKIKVKAADKSEATQKVGAAVGLMQNFDIATLKALQKNGPALFSNPDLAPFIKSYLGLQ